jgi:hypothetical protein
MNYDKLVIIRNRKGNPGYLDLYIVKPPGELVKECTIKLCGYSVTSNYSKITSVKQVLLNLAPAILSIEKTNKAYIDHILQTLDCIIKMFNVTITNKDEDLKKRAESICMNIDMAKPKKDHDAKDRKIFFKIVFAKCSNKESYLTLNICNNKCNTRSDVLQQYL